MSAETSLWERITGALGVLTGRYDWYDPRPPTEEEDIEAGYIEPDWSNPPPGYMDEELRAAYDEGYRDGQAYP